MKGDVLCTLVLTYTHFIIIIPKLNGQTRLKSQTLCQNFIYLFDIDIFIIHYKLEITLNAVVDRYMR